MKFTISLIMITLCTGLVFGETLPGIASLENQEIVYQDPQYFFVGVSELNNGLYLVAMQSQDIADQIPSMKFVILNSIDEFKKSGEFTIANASTYRLVNTYSNSEYALAAGNEGSFKTVTFDSGGVILETYPDKGLIYGEDGGKEVQCFYNQSAADFKTKELSSTEFSKCRIPELSNSHTLEYFSSKYMVIKFSLTDSKFMAAQHGLVCYGEGCTKLWTHTGGNMQYISCGNIGNKMIIIAYYDGSAVAIDMQGGDETPFARDLHSPLFYAGKVYFFGLDKGDGEPGFCYWSPGTKTVKFAGVDYDTYPGQILNYGPIIYTQYEYAGDGHFGRTVIFGNLANNPQALPGLWVIVGNSDGQIELLGGGRGEGAVSTAFMHFNR